MARGAASDDDTPLLVCMATGPFLFVARCMMMCVCVWLGGATATRGTGLQHHRRSPHPTGRRPIFHLTTMPCTTHEKREEEHKQQLIERVLDGCTRGRRAISTDFLHLAVARLS
jgi:hypothetical protein